MRELLHETADYAADFLESLPERPRLPLVDAGDLRARLGGPVPDGPTDAREVVADLAAVGARAAVAIPAAALLRLRRSAAPSRRPRRRLADLGLGSERGPVRRRPAAAVARRSPARGSPTCCGIPRAVVHVVTGTPDGARDGDGRGAQPRARARRLGRGGERPDRRAADPRLRGREGALDVRARAALHRPRHGVDRAVPADDQGRMRRRRAPRGARGARRPGDRLRAGRRGEHRLFDDFDAIADAAEAAGAWLHVDGAFGLWAAALPRFAHLVAGAERADSWATDGHKWLNVPVRLRDRVLRPPGAAPRARCRVQRRLPDPRRRRRPRDEMDWTPEFSRRARGFTVYAAIRSLGRSGIAELVERCCDLAAGSPPALADDPGRRGAERGRAEPGALPLRDRRAHVGRPRRGSAERCRLDERHGLGGPSGDPAVGFNWQTTADDIDRTLAAFADAAA